MELSFLGVFVGILIGWVLAWFIAQRYLIGPLERTLDKYDPNNGRVGG